MESSGPARRSADPDRRFLRRAMDEKLLERDEEQELARRWKDQRDEAALHNLTQAYMRLVISVASRFRKYGLPFADLVQEGNVGLMEAAARFEPDRDVRFSTYAAWWIRSSIQDYVLRNWSIVRTGTTSAQKTLFFNLRRVRAMIDDVGTTMSPEQRAKIATLLRVKESDVEAMSSRLAASDRSLNAPMGEDGDATWMDFLPDEQPAPEDDVMLRHDSAKRVGWVRDAMQVLTEREQLIIRERKLNDDEVVTLEALGDRLGISKERVRQIEHQALGKLSKALKSRFGEDEVDGLIADG